MRPIKLSLVICSIHSRATTARALVQSLQKQPRINEVEILLAIDDGQDVTGNKRNRLVASALGKYIAHIDDDDDVSPHYLDRILSAIDKYPVVDAITIRGRRTHEGGKPVEFDYILNPAVEGRMIDGVVWRTPGHLCAIRSEIAKSTLFPSPRYGEDLAWSAEIAPKLKTAARASDEVLYFYLWDPSKYKDPAYPRNRVEHMTRSHQEIFTPQYRNISGPGSTAENSAPYRAWLSKFILDHAIRNIIDFGCGDMQLMRKVNFYGADYCGIDVIDGRIAENNASHGLPAQMNARSVKFIASDLRSVPIYRGHHQLIICKDVLQHWATAEVVEWLMSLKDHLRADPTAIALITNCNYGPTVNQDISTGGWRALDLTAPPFKLGKVAFQWGTKETGGAKDVVLINHANLG